MNKKRAKNNKKNSKEFNKIYLLILAIIIIFIIVTFFIIKFKTSNVILLNCIDSDSSLVFPKFDDSTIFIRGYSSIENSISLLDKCWREDIIQEAVCKKTIFGVKPSYSKEDCPSGTVCSSNNGIASCVSSNVCGNGIIEEAEKCELNNLNGQTCASLGFLKGELKCSKNCQFDTSNCINSIGLTCIDTDGGINKSLNGTVTEYFNGVLRYQRKDGCLIVGNNNPAYPSGRLLEFYCNDSKLTSTQINCTRGIQCREGKCLM